MYGSRALKRSSSVVTSRLNFLSLDLSVSSMRYDTQYESGRQIASHRLIKLHLVIGALNLTEQPKRR